MVTVRLLKKVITFQKTMTRAKIKKVVTWGKNRVTPSVAAPGDANLSDAAAWTHASCEFVSFPCTQTPTLVIVQLQSSGQHHGTDYRQQSGHLTLFRISKTDWKLTVSDGPFHFFSIHLEHGHPWIGLHATVPKKLHFIVIFLLYFVIDNIGAMMFVWR